MLQLHILHQLFPIIQSACCLLSSICPLKTTFWAFQSLGQLVYMPFSNIVSSSLFFLNLSSDFSLFFKLSRHCDLKGILSGHLAWWLMSLLGTPTICIRVPGSHSAPCFFFLLMRGRQQRMPSVRGSLSFTWDTCTEFQASAFSPASRRHLRGELVNGSSLHLSLCPSNKMKEKAKLKKKTGKSLRI